MKHRSLSLVSAKAKPPMERIVWLDRNAIQVPVRKPRNGQYDWVEYSSTPSSEVVSRLELATIAITNRTFISREVLEQCPRLRYIAVCATGYDHVDIEACKEKNVSVSNVRNWAISVPEHVFSLILALRRQIIEYHELVKSGAWAAGSTWTMAQKPYPFILRGSVLGIIGNGVLAKMVVTIAQGFGMHIRISERKDASHMREGRISFGDTLKESDVLLLLCPLTDETRNMIGKHELSLMKRSALLINCARGGIVNEQALADAVKEGVIAGTATDVLSNEPPKGGNPLIDANLNNILITPHVGWLSVESLNNIVEQLIGLIEAFMEGQPKNLVT